MYDGSGSAHRDCGVRGVGVCVCWCCRCVCVCVDVDVADGVSSGGVCVLVLRVCPKIDSDEQHEVLNPETLNPETINPKT